MLTGLFIKYDEGIVTLTLINKVEGQMGDDTIDVESMYRAHHFIM